MIPMATDDGEKYRRARLMWERGRRTVHMTIRVTEEERTWMRAIADENGVPLATAIREAVVQYVGDYRDPDDVPWLKTGVGMCNSPRN